MATLSAQEVTVTHPDAQQARLGIMQHAVSAGCPHSVCSAPDLEDELEEEDAAPPTASRRRGTDADAIGDFLEVCLAHQHRNVNLQTVLTSAVCHTNSQLLTSPI